MASIALRAENSCFLSHYCASTQSSIFFNKSVASLTKSNSHFRYSRNRLKLGVSCSIKERESERVSELLGNGLLVERLEQAGPSLGSDYEKDSGLEEVGLEGNWPPWERIPERYKLIGTTSLAFVICNMDKVVDFLCPRFLLLFDNFKKHVVSSRRYIGSHRWTSMLRKVIVLRYFE